MQSLNPSSTATESSTSNATVDDSAFRSVVLTHGPASQRIQTVDIVRGFALLGILLINIVGFGLPILTYLPRLFALPPDSLDFKTFATVSIVFEGTMRGLFSMLFGAGIILFTAKKDTIADGYTVADYYYRRLLWLVVFGLINAYVLLWPGDILYATDWLACCCFLSGNSNPERYSWRLVSAF